MNKTEERAISVVRELVPYFDKVEFSASIGDTSHSVEFFVWVNGEKFQCYELVDSGKIDGLKMDNIFNSFAEFVRKSEEYKAGEVNRVNFVS